MNLKLFLVVLVDEDGEVGILQVHYHHPVPWAEQIPKGRYPLHLEVGSLHPLIQPFQVDHWPHLTISLWY